MVLSIENLCDKCVEIYTYVSVKWCKPCQINNLKGNFTNWTSGNEIIDDFIQYMQLKIDNYDDVIFEWIPFKRFNEIKSTGNYGTVYSAIWKDGLLYYSSNKKKLMIIAYCHVMIHG